MKRALIGLMACLTLAACAGDDEQPVALDQALADNATATEPDALANESASDNFTDTMSNAVDVASADHADDPADTSAIPECPGDPRCEPGPK